MERVLIANRGEIAVRIIHACHDSGRKAIAVYADADANALFVRLADEAYALTGTTPAQTYLNIDAIIAIARKAHADAVHPGYGFLSENTDFAQAVLDAGLVWIGPSPHTIRILGDKVEARRIAAEVGAPMAPGTIVPVHDPKEVVRFAKEHGLPIAIKPCTAAADAVLRWCAGSRTSRRRSNRPHARPKSRSATATASSSDFSTGRATSKCRSSPTRTATSRRSAHATARCNAATRS